MKQSTAVAGDCVMRFEQIAAANPEKVAVVDELQSIKFGPMQDEITRRSAILSDQGLAPGDRIALVAESSANYLITALAIWKAGGVLVTIYPASGPEDLRFAIEKSDPALVIVSTGMDLESVAAGAPNAPIADIDAFDVSGLYSGTSRNPTDLREPLALICFSSGTTSRPKAIMISQNTIYNCAMTYGEVWHLDTNETAIICLPMAWMYGLASTSLAVLLNGGTVIALKRSKPELLTAAIREHQATFLAGVTATFAKLAQYLVESDAEPTAISSLRLCISGGEPRNEQAFSTWKHVTGVAVLDAYCASECLPLVTYDPWEDPEPLVGSAGKLVPRARLKIMREDGSEAAPGEVGEAYSGGPGLMLGYWRDEEQTRASLTDDGWYRTKDLVQIDEQGYVHVVGRLSDLIIRGGTNISPAEVERAVRLHKDVADAAVVGMPDDIYGQKVVAAVIARRGLVLDEKEIRSYLSTQLSAYKIPSEIHVLADLPLNSTTGKVDRRRVAQLISDKSPIS